MPTDPWFKQSIISSPIAAFGELRVVEPHPEVQVDGVYGLLSNLESLTATGGSVTASDGNIVCQTGTSVGGYGVARSRRAVRYRPGQGCVFRFTTIFDTANAVANSLQIAGPFNAGSGFVVGYDGANGFGCMHRTGGKHEIRTLTVSDAATGAETFTLTLNSVAYAIPVTSGTTAFNAYEIATWLQANQSVWDARQNGSTVVLFGQAVGPLSGTYSVSSDGDSAGSIAQTAAGVAVTETWTYQASFSEDVLDGTGASGITLDPSKGNVWEINVQYLGYGAVTLAVENPNTGRFTTVHIWQFANSRTTPTMTNPTLKIGWAAASLGSTTNITVKGASALGAVDGIIRHTRYPQGFSHQKGSIAATLTSIFAVRVRRTLHALVNLSEILPSIIYASPAGNKEAEVRILLNPVFSSTPNWSYIDEDASIVEVDTSAGTMSDTGTLIGAFTVSGSATQAFRFAEIAEGGRGFILQPNDVLVIAAKITGGAGSNVTASLTWIED